LTAVIYIDVAQVLIMLAGSSVLFVIGLNQVGGWNSLQERLVNLAFNHNYNQEVTVTEWPQAPD